MHICIKYSYLPHSILGGKMIDTTEKLVAMVRLRHRFIKEAAIHLGFKNSRDYQRFRNTLLGASRDYQVIVSLLKEIPDIDTKKLWGIERDLILSAAQKGDKLKKRKKSAR